MARIEHLIARLRGKDRPIDAYQVAKESWNRWKKGAGTLKDLLEVYQYMPATKFYGDGRQDKRSIAYQWRQEILDHLPGYFQQDPEQVLSAFNTVVPASNQVYLLGDLIRHFQEGEKAEAPSWVSDLFRKMAHAQDFDSVPGKEFERALFNSTSIPLDLKYPFLSEMHRESMAALGLMSSQPEQPQAEVLFIAE